MNAIIRNPSPELDRLLFGAYLSGFVDGEGSFMLRAKERIKKTTGAGYLSCRATFAITLRLDDLSILQDICKFLKCGNIECRQRKEGCRSKPVGIYSVRNLEDLVCKIVPFFELHHLRAKKARDFEIWKQGVALLYEIKNRTRRKRTDTKWMEVDKLKFWEFVGGLKKVREYIGPIEGLVIKRTKTKSIRKGWGVF